LIARLRDNPSLEIGFLPINPRLPGVLRKLQAIKYVRTVVTSLLYVVTLFARVHKYDVLHVFSASYLSFVIAATPAILIGKLFRKRVLLNYHSGEAEDHLARWSSAIATIKLADEVVVPSEYLVRVFGSFGIQAHAINNLIELDTFKFRERAKLRPRFLTNRNFEPHYGVDCVLRAFATIQRRVPDAELVIAGHGDERLALEDLARQLELRNASFIGRVEPEKIYARYDDADIYLNGSNIDNQPLSILEAFACGLPVVTTNAGGIRDMVTDEVTGFVVERGDHEALARNALWLLEDPHTAERVTRQALKECEKYTWNYVGDQWIRRYETLAGLDHVEKANAPKSPFSKLSRMSFAEMRVRGMQLFHKVAERNGWSGGLLSDKGLLFQYRCSKGSHTSDSTDQLLHHFRDGERPAFFSSFDNGEATVTALRTRWPEAEKQIVENADRILSGHFDLLGYTELSFGHPINWQLEPLSGKMTPLIHWSQIDYLDANVAGDKKIIWELNRHQYFVKLGQAYWLTKDEKYAECFAEHLESWMAANPPKLGINWASSLEIAFRSIAWLWALHFFKNATVLTPALFSQTLKHLYLNARHLETYLSTYFSPNTHLTGEALGLFYLGIMLPEFREATRWRTTGKKILVDQLSNHVRPDGVYFEQSSYYHRYTVDFYTHFLVLSRLNEQEVDSVVEQKLKLLLDHLMYITRPDGSTPLFGDDDGGRLIILDRRRANDCRSALSNGAALFERGDYKYVAGAVSEETLWLLGVNGMKQFENTRQQQPANSSKAFADGGYYVMRDKWAADANYLLFDCGPHGVMNGGHAHADALATQVSAQGQSLLEDTGTYTYTGSASERDAFRGSAAHNVLLVDGESSSVPSGPFTWRSTATSNTRSWMSERRFDFVEGEHDGYKRLSDPVGHSRSILFLKNDYWVMRDRITAQEAHELDLRFHFAAGLHPQLTQPVAGHRNPPPVVTTRDERGAGMDLVTFGEGSWQREEGWISHCYGKRESAPVWTFSTISKGNAELITLLFPQAKYSDQPTEMREVEAIGGRAFEITQGNKRDLVLVRDPRARRIQTISLVSDFTWTWARFSSESSELPQELLVLDGRTLELNGKEILTSAKPVSFLVASKLGNKFRLETSEGHLDFAFPIVDLDSLLAESVQHRS
jgi:glycosyltransferase involved in cell wall biosynthesis